jgi:Mor family transcriptional regulator
MDKSAIEVIKQFANDYNIPYKELKKKYLITNILILKILRRILNY